MNNQKRLIFAALLLFCLIAGAQTTIETKQADIVIEEADPTKFPPNEFSGSFTVTTQATNKKGQLEDPVVLDIYASDYPVAFEMLVPDNASQKMRFIVDPRTALVTTLIDDNDNKTGMITKMPKITVKMKEGKTVPDKPAETTVQATDEYKMIEGYRCRKYIITDGTTVTESWITVDDAVSIHQIMSMFALTQKQKTEDFGARYGGVRGMVLESTTTLANGQKSRMTVTNIRQGNVDQSKFSTEGYQVIDMSQGMKGLFGGQ